MRHVVSVKTITLQGSSPICVNVEVHITSGMPSFSIVGLPSKSIQEAKERITAALEIMGLSKAMQKIVVNLGPADLYKTGSHYDLPITLGILASLGVIEAIPEYLALGEMSLDGKLLPVKGVLSAAIYAESQGLNLICPRHSADAAAWCVSQSKILAPRDLMELINHFKGTRTLAEPVKTQQRTTCNTQDDIFDQIVGQDTLKRMAQIACAGFHHMLMIGPPGVGKSLIARSMQRLLPPLAPRERIEVSMTHSLADPHLSELITVPPFRAPHHTSSVPGLIGGGSKAAPGEVSLAHYGILFLDELAEFDRRAIDSLRTIMETGHACITRAQYKVSYPAHFLLIGATNPCRCGHLDDPKKACSRAPKCGEEYMRISGPMMDRFDLSVRVKPVQFDTYSDNSSKNSNIRMEEINTARSIQRARLGDRLNRQMTSEEIKNYVQLTPEVRQILQSAQSKWNLSMRAVHKTLCVTRTISDLRGNKTDTPSANDLLEAMSYRLTK